ncbi:hypothetical protein BDD43_5895 [Mucilaginibacter gracilis]|uniref:Glycerophosphoryl diester phosphodiesterase family protein n=1 Tax=Mucilaginibacter gracilis TaxID=423350 RepID=A0A495JB45_9SPHI|nr:hypothetical protein [Mucilaginibacter gracilis]RKR85624.1 hypothetical protein BDD43_5895 [Mucilaginibacter gracilis]
MLPNVELIQIRNFTEIVDDSILFFKQNWKPLIKTYFTICGFFWIAGLIIAVFNQTQIATLQEKGESIFTLAYFLTLFFSFLNFTILSLTVLSFISLYQQNGNQAPTVAEVWSYVKYYMLRFFFSSVALTAILAVATLCCVLPGIWFTPVYLMVITVMVLENASLGYSIRRGYDLLAQNWWHTFGVIILMGIIILAVIVLLLIPVTVIVGLIVGFTQLDHNHAITIAIALSFSSMQFLYVLPIIAIAVVYHNLNQRMDDHSLFERIEMIGKTDNNNQLPTEEY